MQPKTILYYTSILLVGIIFTIIIKESKPIVYSHARTSESSPRGLTARERQLMQFYDQEETKRQAKQPAVEYITLSYIDAKPIPKTWWASVPERYVALLDDSSDDKLELVFFTDKRFGLYYFNAASEKRVLYQKGVYNRVDGGSFLLTSDDISEVEGEYRCANISFHGLFYSYANLEQSIGLLLCNELPSDENVYEVWEISNDEYGLQEKHTGLIFLPDGVAND